MSAKPTQEQIAEAVVIAKTIQAGYYITGAQEEVLAAALLALHEENKALRGALSALLDAWLRVGGGNDYDLVTEKARAALALR